MTAARSYLFLQGVSSPFFGRLSAALRRQGHEVHTLAFNVGDVLYGRCRTRASFRGRAEPRALERFYERHIAATGATDIVLFGDCRPVHRPAVELARKLGVRTHVFEEGYFRPNWITLERDGVNGNSRLPRDPDWYRAVAASLPRCGNGNDVEAPFWVRAAHDVAYHACGLLNPLGYPGYRTHGSVVAPVYYAGFVRRYMDVMLTAREDEAVVRAVASREAPTFLFPMQLDNDAQIRDHSSFENMEDAMRAIMRSFGRHAPRKARLVVKNHPLSPGLVNYRRVTAEVAREHGLEGRVSFIDSGHMPTLLSHVNGVVTINSTAGGSALVHKRKLIALGDPIYALPGLTFQGTLDAFWTERFRPDMELFEDFRNTVIHTTQINGGFYTRQGIEMAIRNSLPSLTGDQSALEALLEPASSQNPASESSEPAAALA